MEKLLSELKLENKYNPYIRKEDLDIGTFNSLVQCGRPRFLSQEPG